jgi:hypothetical protein
VTLQAPWQKDKKVFRWLCWSWIGTENSVDIQRRRELAAVVQLPPGYSLAFVPQDAVVLPLHANDDGEVQPLSVTGANSPLPSHRNPIAKYSSEIETHTNR